jgi:hypothetical protein
MSCSNINILIDIVVRVILSNGDNFPHVYKLWGKMLLKFRNEEQNYAILRMIWEQFQE